MGIDWAEIAQESAEAAGFEARALSRLSREVGCEAALFLVRGLERTPTALGFDERMVARAVTRRETYARELMPVKRAALAARGVAVDSEVLGLHGVQKCAYHREVAARIGGKHSLMAYVPWRGQVVAAVMLGRTGQGFSRRELGRVESELKGLGVARAAFGLPSVSEALPGAPEQGLLSRLGWGPGERVLERRRGLRETLLVRDRAGFREMVASDAGSELVWSRAALSEPRVSGWPYLELFHVAAALAKQRRRALFVGCGGGVALHQFASVYPGLALDLVERDPAVLELARRWFALDALAALSVHVADGADFVVRARPATWDVALVDAYGAAEFDGPFATRSFFAALRRALTPDGAAAFNVIGALSGPGPVQAIVRLARAEFADVRMLPVLALSEEYAPSTRRNVVVVASGVK